MNQPEKRHSKRLRDSFRYAGAGLLTALKRERNFRIHLAATILAVAAGFLCALTPIEWAVLITLIALVLTAELFNTSLEALVDLASPALHPLAKIAKDTAAAAVLILSLAAVAGGLLIFVPKLPALLMALQ